MMTFCMVPMFQLCYFGSNTCIGDISRSSFDMLCSQAWHPKPAFIVNMTTNAADSKCITAINIFGLTISNGRLVEKLCCLPKLQMGKRLDNSKDFITRPQKI